MTLSMTMWIVKENAGKSHFITSDWNIWRWRYVMVIVSECQSLFDLTHRGRDKMAAISQTTVSNAFSSMKMLKFRSKFHWTLSIRLPLTKFQHLATSHYLNQWCLVYWRIYASLGLNELNPGPNLTIDTDARHSANSSTAFKWNLCYHWRVCVSACF